MVYQSLWPAHIPMETSKWRQELKLGERGHGDKGTFLALGDSVLNDLPALMAWSLPLCTRQIHIHPKASVFFFLLPTHIGDPRKAALFLLWVGSSLVSYPSFCGSFLWIPSTSFLPLYFFFFFARREPTSDFMPLAAITDNTALHSSWDDTS